MGAPPNESFIKDPSVFSRWGVFQLGFKVQKIWDDSGKTTNGQEKHSNYLYLIFQSLLKNLHNLHVYGRTLLNQN